MNRSRPAYSRMAEDAANCGGRERRSNTYVPRKWDIHSRKLPYSTKPFGTRLRTAGFMYECIERRTTQRQSRCMTMGQVLQLNCIAEFSNAFSQPLCSNQSSHYRVSHFDRPHELCTGRMDICST